MAENQNSLFLCQVDGTWEMTEEAPDGNPVKVWTCEEFAYNSQVTEPDPPKDLVRGRREFIGGRWRVWLWPVGVEPLEPPEFIRRQWIRTPSELEM